jgi:2-hydroxy-3-oxopropionate reductase
MKKPDLKGQKIGFVGLGNMGRANARHLLAAGAEMHVWNRSAAPALEAAALGMRRHESLVELAAAVGAGMVFLNLTTTEVVREVVFGEGGLQTELSAEGLVVDLGTTSPVATREFASVIPWLDSPVSGGQLGAEAATLSLMVGGSRAHFERALPALEVISARVTHMGESGSGQVTKLANQLIVAQTIDAVAQALRLAELSGVDPALVREALLGGFAESRILQLHGERMIKRDFAPGGRSVLQLKDVRLICEHADAVGLRSATLDNCLQQWETFVGDHAGGELDHSGLFQMYLDRAES